MGLIHSHAAAALQYGIERDFTNRTEQVVFYDMGSGTVEAALVKFSSYVDKKVCGRCWGPLGGAIGKSITVASGASSRIRKAAKGDTWHDPAALHNLTVHCSPNVTPGCN